MFVHGDDHGNSFGRNGVSGKEQAVLSKPSGT